MTGVIAVLLALMVAAAWLAAAGFARLRAPLDRLHAVAFVNAACGVPLLLAALLAEGFSTRSIKIAIILAANLIGGAAVAHATGRAIVKRNGVEP